MTAPSILAAKAEAAAARADLTATLGELQNRLAPRTLAQNAWDEVRERGEVLADRGSHFAKRRPAATAGIAAATGLLLFRKPVGRLLKRLFSRKSATPVAGTPFPPGSPSNTALSVEEEIVP